MEVHNLTKANTTSITDAEAYGYGFLMIAVISLLSLLGVTIVPFVHRSSKLAVYYKYIITLLISMGVSALVTDALLHLIPNSLDLHSHNHGSDSRDDEKGVSEREVIWRMCGVVAGATSFFILELFLHTCSSRLGHTHSHRALLDSITDTASLLRDGHTATSDLSIDRDASPHVKSKKPDQQYGTVGTERPPQNGGSSCLSYITSIKPLAWVIILGDSMHNLTDGLAVGVAISQTLGLGLSTAVAILFHEIPHELSDYAILLHTGMSWNKALFLNFLSALTALIGFFAGVAIGTRSEEANKWLLVVIAGQFLYIALVDLLPEVLHSKEKGWSRVVEVAMIFTGFAIGFSILLTIALLEHSIDVSIH